MNEFLASGYSFDPAALPYLVAALLAAGIGGGLLLYERFTPASRRFFVVAVVLAAWLVAYGVSYLAVDQGLERLWYRLALALITLGLPPLYGLALQLTGRRKPRVEAALWGVGAVLAGVAAALVPGRLTDHFQRSMVEGWGLVAAVFVAYLGAAVGLVIFEFWQGFRSAQGGAERRRHLIMLAAIAVGGLGLMDFFVPARPALPSGITPLAIIVALAIMAVAGTRYRAFSLSAKFGTDEVLRAMGDAVLVCDAGGIVRVANEEAQRLLGESDAALVGLHVGQWLRAPDGGEGPVRPGAPFTRDALVRDQRMCLRPEHGPPIEVSVSIEPVSAGDERRGLVIVARDIRDRVRSERALQTAERRYMSLFWHNPGAAYEIDLEGRFQSLNPSAERLLGASSADVVGRPFGDVIIPDDMAQAESVFEAVLRGESREYELTVRFGSGEPREIRGVSIPILDDGVVAGIFGVALDITEATAAKRALETQRRYFADLFEGSPEGIVLVEAETDRVLRVNGEFQRLFGYTAEEAVGQNLNDLIVPPHLAAEGPRLNRAAREGGRLRTETVRRRKDGTLVDVSVLARTLPIPGEPEQLYGVYRDITDRKETEQALREREEELRHAQKLEAVGKLAGGIAHDFNNLLTVINGHTGFALENIEAGSPLQQDLLEIEKAGARAASLTQQLLAYSRRQVLHPQLLDPNTVVLEIRGMLGRLIGAHIRVETRLNAEDVRVRADRGQLEQVLVNLVVNARDAMPEGGTLTLGTDELTLEAGDPRIARWDVVAGTYVRLRVSDTGTGMDPDTLQHAFEPFFTTKEQGKGTGLGLATVFGIVKQSGGHVMATSEPGAGTVCDVILPRVRMPASGEAPRVAPASSSPRAEAGPAGTVLVVEDQAAVRKLAVRVLERAGCTVLSAENGARALEKLEVHEGALDLVLTDLVMPDMGGRELADHLRRRRPGVPILFMSGYDDALFSETDSRNDFIAKPFTPADLARRVTEALQAPSA